MPKLRTRFSWTFGILALFIIANVVNHVIAHGSYHPSVGVESKFSSFPELIHDFLFHFEFLVDTAISVSALVALAIAARHLNYSVVQPVERMTDAIERLSRTGETGAIPEASRTDEVGALARTIVSFGEAVRVRNQAAEIRIFADNLPALIIYVDAERRYRFANRMAAEWYGRPVEQIIGRRLDEVMSSASYARLKPHIDAALAGEAKEFEAEVDHAGHTRAVEGKLVPDRGSDGAVRGYFAFGMDVSARRAADTRLRLIADSLPGLIAYIGADSSIKYANKTLGTWYGTSSEGALGKSAVEIFGPDIMAEVKPCLDAAFAGQAQRFEASGTYPDGIARHLDVTYVPDKGQDGRVRGIAVLSIDVTAQREQDARLKLLTDNLPAHVAYIDAEGRFQFVNATTAAWYARPAIELLGKRPSELLEPGSHAAFADHLQRALNGESQRFEATIRFPDGIERTVDVSYVPELGSDGRVRGCFALSLDITEQRANSALFKMIANNLPALLVYLDMDGVFRFANQTCERWYARPASEIVGQHVANVLGPTWYKTAGPRIEAALRGERSRWSATLAYPDGKMRTVDFTYVPDMGPDGRVKGMFALTVDLTEQQAAAEQTRIIADNLPVMVNYIDRTQRYRFVNKMTERWYGRPASEILGKTTAEILGPGYEAVRPNIEAALAGTPRTFDARVPYPDGRTRDVEIRYIPDLEANGTPRGFYGIVLDTTERRAVEEQLRQMQKMESVGQLTGGIAHDFNNLLAVVIGSLDLLSADAGRDAEDRELIDRAREASRKGAELTKRLLAFARKQQLRPQTTNVAELTRDMASLLGRTLGEQIRIETDMAANLWPVHIDRVELETALINLAVNARDAMPKGGRLTLRARNFTAAPASAMHAGELAPGDYVTIMVTDDGLGMPAVVKAKAFDPFFTTKDIGKGTGLGLSMVYGFAKQSGGHAEIDSHPGVGTTVTLYLPRAIGMPVQTPAPSRPIKTAPSSGTVRRILIVDDNRGVRDFCVKAAQKLGYAVVAAGGGEEALAALDQDPTITLMLTDIVQPGGMNGFELAAAAQRARPTLNIVFMSGFVDGRIAGGDSMPPDAVLLAKPFHMGELSEALAQAFGDAPARERHAVSGL